MYADFQTASKGVTVIEPVADLLFPLGFFYSGTQGNLGRVRYRIWKTHSRGARRHLFFLWDRWHHYHWHWSNEIILIHILILVYIRLDFGQ